jgi:hypothetical protein
LISASSTKNTDKRSWPRTSKDCLAKITIPELSPVMDLDVE